ncbi:MAG TPA: pantoate--beta-alanine ligase [Gelria sp.]|jgi:pantoate--beta-alanine ligase|nr:pantoate--beta-alanine ligase [Gelria sp.]
MQIFDNISSMQEWSLQMRKQGNSIGLVPTMGYLHEGHLSLVKEAIKNCDKVVVSIFVNPMQFGQGEDFEEYPRDLSRDTSILEKMGVDAVFAPTAREMYPSGFSSSVEVSGEIAEKMCGASRPGHFKGVTTVCTKLFHACLPDLAFYGQKDAQQLLIIEKMVRELNFPLKIIRVPTVREEDGLALSSRNVYLEGAQRQEALVLIKALKQAQKQIRGGERDITRLTASIKEIIATSPQAEIDYVEILNGDDLSELERIEGRVLIALAVKFGNTRLIDNLLVEV